MAATAADLNGANLVNNHSHLQITNFFAYNVSLYYQGAHIMLAGIVFQLGKLWIAS